MEIKNIQVTTNTKGETSCGDLGISSSEWYNLLKDPHSKAYHNVLFCILRMPMHKSSCKSLSEEYGKTPQHYNSKVIAFAQWAQKSLITTQPYIQSYSFLLRISAYFKRIMRKLQCILLWL